MQNAEQSHSRAKEHVLLIHTCMVMMQLIKVDSNEQHDHHFNLERSFDDEPVMFVSERGLSIWLKSSK
ncbi:hypothetical protein AKG37_16260 [Bacillus australimaris]|uniref:Uncharacterized protein n=1 Tax=Bacillus australimaris TaxID=1326968 RepID=A0ABD4QHE6_9BACI|nr:hypothetical protein [Bacillus australimaris]KPN15213.1 hypothetical protein AKG37_16260 [Bacillus australimaris]MBR8689108.1 hypothetical protein [Bacillus australimaris]